VLQIQQVQSQLMDQVLLQDQVAAGTGELLEAGRSGALDQDEDTVAGKAMAYIHMVVAGVAGAASCKTKKKLHCFHLNHQPLGLISLHPFSVGPLMGNKVCLG